MLKMERVSVEYKQNNFIRAYTYMIVFYKTKTKIHCYCLGLTSQSLWVCPFSVPGPGLG